MNQKDERLERVEQITINFETFKKALKRNYLDPNYTNRYHDRSFVLRLYPPFESEMEAEYYESMQGRHYNNNWNEKPYHIKPELMLMHGCGSDPFIKIVEYPTKENTRWTLDDEILDDNDIEDLVDEGREIFWSELKNLLPDTVDLGRVHGYGSYPVEINWAFED